MVGKIDLTKKENALQFINYSETKTDGSFENVRKKIKIVFNQICNLFVEFRWINEDKIKTKISKKIEELKLNLKSKDTLSKQELLDMNFKIGEMKEICQLLKESAGESKKLKEIDHKLDVVVAKLSKKIDAIQKSKISFAQFPNIAEEDSLKQKSNELEKTVNLLEGNIASLKEKRDLQEKIIEDLKAEVQSEKKLLEKTKKSNLDKKTKLKNKLTKKKWNIEELKTELKEKSSAIQKLESELNQKNTKIMKLEKVLIEKQLNFEKIEEKLEKYYAEDKNRNEVKSKKIKNRIKHEKKEQPDSIKLEKKTLPEENEQPREIVPPLESNSMKLDQSTNSMKLDQSTNSMKLDQSTNERSTALIQPKAKQKATEDKISAALVNLKLLHDAKSKENLTDDIASQAFITYKNSKVGAGYRVGKYVSSTLAYTTVIAPVAGIGYWGVKKYLEDPMSIGLSMAKTLWGGVTSAPVKTLIGILGVGTTEKIGGRLLGSSPTKYATLGALLLLSGAVAYAASQAGNMVASSYEQDEKIKEKLRTTSHALMYERIKSTFDIAADELDDYLKTNIHKPKKILEAMLIAEELESKFSFFEKELGHYELDQLQIKMILENLKKAVKSIKKQSFAKSKDMKSYHFNRKLLSAMPTEKLLQNLPRIKSEPASSRYISKTTGAFIGAGLQVALPTLVAVGGYFACPELLRETISSCLDAASLGPYKEVITNTGAPFLAANIISSIAYKSYKNFTSNLHEIKEEERISDEKVVKLKNQVADDYKNICDGVALSLEALKEEKSEKLKEIADSIAPKIPLMKAQIYEMGISNADEITEKLENVIQTLV